MKFYKEALSTFESNLEQLELDVPIIYDSAEKGIQLCKDTLETLRERVIKKGFKNTQEEALFFKTIKPQVVAYLIHYMNLVYVERHRPIASAKEKHKFYIGHIAVLRGYFIEHKEIYEYHIRNLSHMDFAYFTRNIRSVELFPESIVSIIDNQFSTAKDMVFARIIGNTLTINFLKHKISRNKSKSMGIKRNKSTLKWTGSKVDLIELIYALHSTSALNQGRVDIKKIAQTFEEVFQIELGDYYRTFLEIRGRKLQPTKFLDYLKSNLERRMEEADG